MLIVAIVALMLFGYVMPVSAAGNETFKILIDTNQILSSEAEQAERLKADGTWSIEVNSSNINWPTLYDKLGKSAFTLSEDNPGSTEQADRVSQHLGRMVDAAVFYTEDGLATPITQTQISNYAAHVVPGMGALGNRIVVLTRSFQGPRREQMIEALNHPSVSGGAFEFSTGSDNVWIHQDFEGGCEYITSLGKKCYLLVPPADITYLESMKKLTTYFGPKGTLNNPNVYVVLAAYVRPNKMSFVSLNNDENSLETALKYLNTYRNRSPIGYHDSTNNQYCRTAGWAVDLDSPTSSITLHVYRDGPAGTGVLVGSYPANISRTDVNQTIGVSGNHGFYIQFSNTNPQELPLYSGSHSLYVYGIDTTEPTHKNSLLSSSPQNIACTLPAAATPGDINNDGKVDGQDLLILKSNMGLQTTTLNQKADLNANGLIEIFDYNILVKNYGK